MNSYTHSSAGREHVVDAGQPPSLEEIPAVAARSPDPFQAFGCEVNALSPEALFACYERVGFLYPAKMELLRPIWPQVIETWKRMLQAGTELLTVVTAGAADSANTWASVTAWRTTNHGWATQHLVSIGDPLASRATMLSHGAHIRSHADCPGQQCWFRPSNRYPQKLFGSVPQALGPEQAVVNTLSYVAVPLPLSCADERAAEISIVAALPHHQAELIELVTLIRGPVFVTGEELDSEDLELEALDGCYRAVGLRRYRHVLLAIDRKTGTPLGAAIAYRGPLGINFSLLENRCDLLLRPNLTLAQRSHVATALLAASQTTYDDFTLRQMIVTTDAVTASLLGGKVREYAQSLWLGRAVPAMYRHVDGFYTRVLAFERRRQRAATNTSEPVAQTA